MVEDPVDGWVPGELVVDMVRGSMGFESLNLVVEGYFEMGEHSIVLMLVPSNLPSELTLQSMTLW
jgi:hypothetical protein